jgi:hypothetical protein
MSGGGLIGILVTLLIVGAIAAISVKSLSGVNTTTTSSSPTSTTSNLPTTTTTTPSIPSVALRAACATDLLLLQEAVSTFNALNSSAPIQRESGITPGVASTYPQGVQARRLLTSGILQQWPTSSGFAISLSTTSAGATNLFTPANATSPAGTNTVACQQIS